MSETPEVGVNILYEVLPPGAQLMDSMRAVGYTLKTALADLIDNSVAARATSVDIHFSASTNQPYLAILDDGIGMDARSARNAMQLAHLSAQEERASTDLGRFGLGLKTASLSQARRLTLVSKRGGEVTALVWDLDHIAETQQWSLIVLDEPEWTTLPHVQTLLSKQSGTLVLWQELDRLLDGHIEAIHALDSQMVDARDHLALIFHRFLAGDSPFPKVVIRVNSVALDPVDPFLSKSHKTQKSSRESIQIEGVGVEVQAFTLPFLNSMSSSERKRALVAGGLRDSQGFYVYRGGRLVIWGTWFRLVPKNDLGKLARVRVDIPNALDHLWSLDIKKSSAVPPQAVKDRLKILAGTIVEPSRRVHRYRGRKEVGDDSLVRPWELTVDRNTFRYEINRAHPVLLALANSLDGMGMARFEDLIQMIEGTFPVQDLFNRMSGDDVPAQRAEDLDRLREVLGSLWAIAGPAGESVDAFISRMTAVEPFDQLRGDRAALAIALEALPIEGQTP